MGTLEKDIVHENASSFVKCDQKRNCYTVFECGPCAAVSDSSYELTSDGLSLAIARSDYIKRRGHKYIDVSFHTFNT